MVTAFCYAVWGALLLVAASALRRELETDAKTGRRRR